MKMHSFATAARSGVLVLLFAPLLLAWSPGPKLRDSRFAVSSVSLDGPEEIRNGGSATYSLVAEIRRDGISADQEIARVRASLIAADKQLVFTTLTIPPRSNQIRATMTLRCVNNEVIGARAGSGHGGRGAFLWWSWADPAAIQGRVNEKDSRAIQVLCR